MADADTPMQFDESKVGDLNDPVQRDNIASHIREVLFSGGGRFLLEDAPLMVLRELQARYPDCIGRLLYDAEVDPATKKIAKKIAEMIKKKAPQPTSGRDEARRVDVAAPFRCAAEFDDRPDSPVLIVTDESWAVAARRLLPDYIATPWHAGDSPDDGIGDLSVLKGRRVGVWLPRTDDDVEIMGHVYLMLVGGDRKDALPIADRVVTIETEELSLILNLDLPTDWVLADATPDQALRIGEEINSQMAARAPRDLYPLRDGVYAMIGDNAQRICGRVVVAANTRDASGANWGRLLVFRNIEGGLSRIAIPNHLLAGNGDDLRRLLADQGLYIGVEKYQRERFMRYINDCDPGRYVLCVAQPGWHGDIYVLRDRDGTAFGAGGPVVPQGPLFGSQLSHGGTLEGWQTEVAAPCLGNDRLVFAVSMAFAGPCLRFGHLDGGGFHFHGPSSSGKSTVLDCAASVWGMSVSMWRSTDNAMESQCAAHNDTILILDEIKQLDPATVVDVTYMIANGQGRRRMKANTELRPSLSWRCLPLSAGEITMEAHAASAGVKLPVGAALRFVSIQPDLDADYGFFADVHGVPGASAKEQGAAFADTLKVAARRHFGTAGVAFLQKLTSEVPAAAKRIAELTDAFLCSAVPSQAPGQVLRVAKRFALVAAAGELAIAYGVVPWSPGTAQASAASCFASWRESWSGKDANAESIAAVEHVRHWIITNGSARFEDCKNDADSVYPNQKPPRISNRAGWRRAGAGGDEYLVPQEVWKQEICKGMDHRAVTKACRAAGLLLPDSEGKPTQPVRLRGCKGTVRVYVLRLAGSPDGRATEET